MLNLCWQFWFCKVIYSMMYCIVPTQNYNHKALFPPSCLKKGLCQATTKIKQQQKPPCCGAERCLWKRRNEAFNYFNNKSLTLGLLIVIFFILIIQVGTTICISYYVFLLLFVCLFWFFGGLFFPSWRILYSLKIMIY